MATQYARGRAFEYRVKSLLEKHGYFVMRSAGSRSPVDLVAFRETQTIFIQCKRHGAIDRNDVNILYDLSMKHGAMPVLSEIPKGKTRGIDLWVLTGKMGRKQRKPLVRWSPDLDAEVAV